MALKSDGLAGDRSSDGRARRGARAVDVQLVLPLSFWLSSSLLSRLVLLEILGSSAAGLGGIGDRWSERQLVGVCRGEEATAHFAMVCSGSGDV